jgi:hypothetical protein
MMMIGWTATLVRWSNVFSSRSSSEQAAVDKERDARYVPGCLSVRGENADKRLGKMRIRIQERNLCVVWQRRTLQEVASTGPTTICPWPTCCRYCSTSREVRRQTRQRPDWPRRSRDAHGLRDSSETQGTACDALAPVECSWYARLHGSRAGAWRARRRPHGHLCASVS